MKSGHSVVIVIIAFVLAFVGIAVAVIAVGMQKDSDITREDGQDSGFVYDEDTDPENDIKIETAYIPLFFPERFGDRVRAEIIDDTDYYLVSFVGKVKDSECRLFDIYFGLDVGFCVGYLDKDGVEIPVYLDIADIERDPQWTDEEYDLACAMQEAMNHTLQRMQESELYREAD